MALLMRLEKPKAPTLLVANWLAAHRQHRNREGATHPSRHYVRTGGGRNGKTPDEAGGLSEGWVAISPM
jgi:hypothetical protein